MQLAQETEMKNAASVEPGDYIDLAGIKYAVIENVPNTFSYGKYNMTLSSVNMSAGINDRIFMIVPFALPMTTYKV